MRLRIYASGYFRRLVRYSFFLFCMCSSGYTYPKILQLFSRCLVINTTKCSLCRHRKGDSKVLFFSVYDLYTQMLCLCGSLVNTTILVFTIAWQFWQQTSKDMEEPHAKQHHWRCLIAVWLFKEIGEPTRKHNNISVYRVTIA